MKSQKGVLVDKIKQQWINVVNGFNPEVSNGLLTDRLNSNRPT